MLTHWPSWEMLSNDILPRDVRLGLACLVRGNKRWQGLGACLLPYQALQAAFHPLGLAISPQRKSVPPASSHL